MICLHSPLLGLPVLVVGNPLKHCAPYHEGALSCFTAVPLWIQFTDNLPIFNPGRGSWSSRRGSNPDFHPSIPLPEQHACSGWDWQSCSASHPKCWLRSRLSALLATPILFSSSGAMLSTSAPAPDRTRKTSITIATAKRNILVSSFRSHSMSPGCESHESSI